MKSTKFAAAVVAALVAGFALGNMGVSFARTTSSAPGAVSQRFATALPTVASSASTSSSVPCTTTVPGRMGPGGAHRSQPATAACTPAAPRSGGGSVACPSPRRQPAKPASARATVTSRTTSQVVCPPASDPDHGTGAGTDPGTGSGSGSGSGSGACADEAVQPQTGRGGCGH